jgi:non-ribosomal peptide synthetase component F
LQNAPAETLDLPDLKLSPLPVTVETAQFDLTLSMVEFDSELRGELTYSTALFDPGTVEEMLSQFVRLLETVAAHPECRLLDITLDAAGNEAESEPEHATIAEDQFAL